MKSVTMQPTTTAGELVEMAKNEPVIVRDPAGRTFALVEVDEIDVEAWSLGNNPNFWQILERSRSRARTEGWLTTDQVREQLGLPSPQRA
jgi:hypothetical protein